MINHVRERETDEVIRAEVARKGTVLKGATGPTAFFHQQIYPPGPL